MAGEMTFLPQYRGSVIAIEPGAELRCPVCNMLMFKGRMASGSAIEIRCFRCRTFTRVKVV